MILHVHPLNKRHDELARSIVNDSYDVRVTHTADMRVGDHYASFDYHLAHCGDSTHDKQPFAMHVFEITELMSNGDIVLDIIPVRTFRLK